MKYINKGQGKTLTKVRTMLPASNYKAIRTMSKLKKYIKYQITKSTKINKKVLGAPPD